MKRSLLAFGTLFLLSACGVGIRTNQTLAPFACTTLPCVFKVDVSDINAANLGGVVGADSICMDNAPTNSTTVKAIIADSSARIACTTANCGGGPSEHTNWPLAANTTYYLINGTTMGTTDANALFTFPLTTAVESSASVIWTGLAADWTTSANTCVNWTSTIGNGASGNPAATTTDLVYLADTACSTGTVNLLCVAN